MKLIHGADGVNDGDVSTANPLPIAQTGALPAGDNNIGNVDVVSSALPTGASTAAKQDTGNTSLASIDTKLDGLATASAQSTSAGKLDTLHTDLAAVNTALGTLATSTGQTTSAGKLDTLHSDLATANTTLGTLATAANQTTSATKLDTINTSLGTLVTTTDFDGKVGALTETAPATDTASSGVNGRLQRIAQRITSLIALLPGSLGAKTAANSFSVTLASDQAAVPITDNSGSITVDGSVTAVGAAASGATISGNPVLNGAEATDGTTTSVTAGQAVTIKTDRKGRLRTVAPRLTHASSNGTAITTATNTTAVAAPSAGTHLRIHRLHAVNSSSTATWVYWCDGSGGTKYFPMYLPSAGSSASINLAGSFELTSVTALVINTTGAGNVEWTVGYETAAD